MRMPRSRSLLIALATLLLVAGCIGADDEDPLPDDEEDATAYAFEDFIVPDHDHEDPHAEGHDYSSPTMTQVAHHQLTNETAPSYIGEIDSAAGMTAVAIVGQGSTPGFVLLDTTDPENPEKLSRVEAPESYAVDVKLTNDGAFALLATQQITNRAPEGGPPSADDVIAWGGSNGFFVYDLDDPTQPELVHFQPVDTTGCHLVTHATVGDNEYVWCVAQSIMTFHFEREPTVTTAPIGTYWPTDEGGYELFLEKGEILPGLTPHDMTFKEDPIDETPLLTVSHWDHGVAVLDVTDPAAPMELARWSGEGAEHYHGYVHSAMPTTVNGERILIVTPETLQDVTSPIWILDISDWDEEPQLLAEWVNPGAHTSQGLLMTVHQIQTVNERLYLAYNHNGIWVFDLATMIQHGGNAPDNSEILGAHMPETDGIPLYPRDSFPMGIPSPWDLNVVNGYILTGDRYTGLHVIHYEDDPKGDPEWTSFA